MNKIISLFTVAALCLCLCACSDKHDSDASGKTSGMNKNYPVTVFGTEIVSAPKRVVSLSPSITEKVTALGCEGLLVGVSDYCDYPVSVAEQKRVGTAILPRTDDIISLSPDLVITNSPLPEDSMQRLQIRDIPVLVVSASNSVDEALESIRLLGLALGGTISGAENSARSLETINAKLTEVKTRIQQAGLSSLSGVYISSQLTAVSSDTFIGSLISAAGGTCLEGGALTVIAERNPDFILCPTGLSRSLLENEALSGTKAVKNGAVFEIETYYTDRQGARIGAAAEAISKLIYPSAYQS